MAFVFGVFVCIVTEREWLLWASFKRCSNRRSAGKAVPCSWGELKSGWNYWRDRTESLRECVLCFDLLMTQNVRLTMLTEGCDSPFFS